MALVSILLSVVALLCTAIGFFTTPIPVLGTLFSFGAAAIALLGVVLAGRAVSAAKRQGRSNDTARIGVVLNALALVPALLVALTCGVCNALFSTGNVQVQRDFQFNLGQGAGPDAGPNALRPPAQAAPGEPAPEPGQPQPGESPARAPSQPGEPGGAVQPGSAPQQVAPSPSTLPPPPLPAGPGR
jgi:hypothetical protein